MVFFLWRTAAFCLLLLYRNKMQHRAFRLYLFAAAVFFRRCFSASAPKTALVLFKRQKGYRFNRCPWVGMYYTCTHPPHTAATGYEGKLLINISNLSQHHLNCQSNPLNHLLQRSAPYNT